MQLHRRGSSATDVSISMSRIACSNRPWRAHNKLAKLFAPARPLLLYDASNASGIEMQWDMSACRIRRDASTLRRIHDYGKPLVIEVSEPTDEALLDGLRRAAFSYFLHAMNPTNGLVADISRENSPSSIAVVGFALSAYPVAVKRGWMGRAEAVKRSLSVLRFFRDSDQSGSPEATGYKGFYYHFLDLHTVPASGTPNCR